MFRTRTVKASWSRIDGMTTNLTIGIYNMRVFAKFGTTGKTHFSRPFPDNDELENAASWLSKHVKGGGQFPWIKNGNKCWMSEAEMEAEENSPF
jgi:hypothetical protein